MALELLAGPFQVLHNGAPAVIGNPMWHDDVGIIGSLGSNAAICQIDGTIWPRGIQIGQWQLGHNLVSGGATALIPGASWKYFDEFDLRILQARNAPTFLDLINPMHKLPDRWISVVDGKIRQEKPTFLFEHQFYIGSGGAWASPANQNTIMAAFAVGAGVAHEYDYVAKAPVGWVRKFPAIVAGASIDGIFYSRAFGVWITIHRVSGAQSVRVWADEVAPVTLSTPAAMTPVAKGRVSEIRVQLTGGDADPCIGFPVNWSLTGPGSIAPEQSITDEFGFASTDYAAPPSGGSADILAEVLF